VRKQTKVDFYVFSEVRSFATPSLFRAKVGSAESW